jgi:hypothetical protein
MTPSQIAAVQSRLNLLHYDAGPADGAFGGRTRTALKQFQEANGLEVDGIYGRNTALALMSPKAIPYAAEGSRPPVALAAKPLTAGTPVWPPQSGVKQVFGNPGSAAATAGRAMLPFPFRIAWDLDQKISSFTCHEKVAHFFSDIFDETARQYGEDEMRRLGLDLFGGCYALRPMRGGSTYSMHAYGIAYDVDPERNQLKWGKDRAQLAKPEYEAFWKIVESFGAISLGRESNFDWMHFQFARLG